MLTRNRAEASLGCGVGSVGEKQRRLHALHTQRAALQAQLAQRLETPSEREHQLKAFAVHAATMQVR